MFVLLFAVPVLRAEEAEFAIEAPRTLLVAPAEVKAPSLVEATLGPTTHEFRADDSVFAAERWGQDFLLTARLPVTEALSLRQELRSGLQSETVLGDPLSASFRDAFTMLEKTAAELRASEALRIAATIQQQWLATNSVPFATITTYGAEARFAPVKATTFKLQAEWQERTDLAAAALSEQDAYRAALEQTLAAGLVTAEAGTAVLLAKEAAPAAEGSVTGRLDGTLKWTPLQDSALALGAELSTRDAAILGETTRAYALRLQQRLDATSRVEFLAGYTAHTHTDAAGTAPDPEGRWNVGASSEIGLAQDVAAGFGVRYQVRDEAPLLFAPEDLSITLSLKGRF
jgi:hypothetical protein